MNYLAHLFLSGPTPEVRIGNLMADFRKGSLSSEVSPGIQRGLHLHHQIDAYTDAHPLVHQSRQLISAPQKRFAGILIDVFYDHFLAKDWMRYTEVPLSVFVQQVYQSLLDNQAFLPAALLERLSDLIQQDWLTSYASLEGVQRSLGRISKRLSRENTLVEGINDLQQHYARFQAHFDMFFPEIIQYIEKQITQGEN